MDDWPLFVILGGLLIASGFCSGSETALFSVQSGELRQRRDRLSDILGRLLNDGERLLLAILVLNNGINVAFFALASYLATSSDQFTPLAMTLMALASLIVCGEIIPKVLASERPLAISLIIAPIWMAIITLTSPVLKGIQYLMRPWLTAPRSGQDFPEIAAEELKMVIEQSRREGVVSPYIHDRLVDVVDLSQIPAYKMMTHRLDCCSIPRSASHEEAVSALRMRPGSYLMVLDETENCIGLIGSQHLLKAGKPLKRMRKPLIIPAVATLAQALELFQRERVSAGVVVDEYGGTEGLLTLAHLAQVLLGKTVDEGLGAVRIEQISDTSWRISGNAPIGPWTTLLEAPALTAEVATIGGFLTRLAGSIPSAGDRLLFNNLLFVIEATEGMRISSILVEKLSAHDARRLTQAGAAI
ncbi:MAG: DUF21 domain-containing protein [Planctomycetota bacterium]|nr:MAG: DUF21 domain-containing protein [Planctomycetota bacterium]